MFSSWLDSGLLTSNSDESNLDICCVRSAERPATRMASAVCIILTFGRFELFKLSSFSSSSISASTAGFSESSPVNFRLRPLGGSPLAEAAVLATALASTLAESAALAGSLSRPFQVEAAAKFSTESEILNLYSNLK